MKNIFKFFTIYRYHSHLGNVTTTIHTNCYNPDSWRLHAKFYFNQISALEEKTSEVVE